jgi:uncharacterized protein YbbK (DUF523 family)
MEKNYIISEKIKIGVSACNTGARIRWNRAGWDRLAPLERERNSFIWTPVCPEVMAGLGVPRSPIRLVGGNGDDFWNRTADVKNREGRDVSSVLRDACGECERALGRAEIEAFVFMEGSPTCGVYRTTMKNKRLGKPPGVFGSLLFKKELFLIPALDLESQVKWWDWRRRLHAFCWLKQQDLQSKSQIFDIWHHFKFICQEVDRAEADEIGRSLAASPKGFDIEFARAWRSRTLDLLRKPSTHRRIASVMQKHYAHYKKHLKGDFKHLQGDADAGSAPDDVPKAPDARLSKYKFVEELKLMENRAVSEGFLFAGTPVIYREVR